MVEKLIKVSNETIEFVFSEDFILKNDRNSRDKIITNQESGVKILETNPSEKHKQRSKSSLLHLLRDLVSEISLQVFFLNFYYFIDTFY